MQERLWVMRALVALAKRNLADANATDEVRLEGCWPAGQEWHELGHTSQHAFMRRAREEAGIPHDAYRAMIEQGCAEDPDAFDAAWEAMGQP